MTEPKPKFAPWPWKVIGTKVFDAFGIVVCSFGMFLRSGKKVTEANRHLLASAPELYNALDEALHYISRCPLTSNADLEKQISDVLAKARGEVRP